MARASELTTDDKFELLVQALMSRQEPGITPDVLKEILSHNATAVQKAMRPENQEHPGLSAFSYPEGDQQKPKTTLPFEVQSVCRGDKLVCERPLSPSPDGGV